jgi:deoxyribose-phosphate aldolase
MPENLPIERAAGGVVVRESEGGREVLLIDDAYGHVTFPKGHLEAGETWEEAAVREVAEETGIQARIVAPLGRVEYRIERNGQPIRKQVRLFLLTPVDKTADPVHQAEEVNGAYYLPWDEAVSVHEQRGYANWSWVLAKAEALWEWQQADWETRWRQLAADVDEVETLAVWEQVSGLVRRIVELTRQELSVVAPDIARALPPLPDLALPRRLDDADGAIRRAVEHTLLRPEASRLEVERAIDEARRIGCRAVCVNPQYVGLATKRLADTGIVPCTVVGFPLGAENVEALADEVRRVTSAGAREVDMVIPIGSMREDDIWTAYQHVRAVVDAARERAGVRVKTILETHYLSFDQVAKAGLVALAAGADYLKTSTGFAASGARLADVALLAMLAGLESDGGRGVKASGGVRNRRQALQFLRYGASRLGTSSGPALLGE